MSNFRSRVLPKGWKKIRIKDFTKSASGGTPLSTKKEYYINGKIPWINSGEVGQSSIRSCKKFITEEGLKNSNATVHPINSVLIALYGATAGKVSLLKIAATTNQAVCAIYPNDKYNSYFLKYYLDTLYHYFVAVSTGSARDNLSQSGIRDLEIFLPNKNAQNKIASILSVLDTKIELNNKINAELEAMAKLIYDYWFVQFDFPDDNGKPYKSSGGRMVYNVELKREIPEGWEVKELGKVAIIKAGGDKPKMFSLDKTDSFTVPIYSNGVVNEGLYGFTNRPTVSEQSVTISARGTIGYCFFRATPFVPIIRLIVVTARNNNAAFYLFQYLKWLGIKTSGSVQKQLTVPQVNPIKTIIPSNDLLNKYHKLSEYIVKKMELLKEENQQLSELRDWLLPMLMNGQVSVE